MSAHARDNCGKVEEEEEKDEVEEEVEVEEEEEEEDEVEEEEKKEKRSPIDVQQANATFSLGVLQHNGSLVIPLRAATVHVKNMTDKERIVVLCCMIQCHMAIPNHKEIADLVRIYTMLFGTSLS